MVGDFNHSQLYKVGGEILYEAAAENIDAVTSIKPHLGVSDQNAEINLSFNVKISMILNGWPVIGNYPASPFNSWHVSE